MSVGINIHDTRAIRARAHQIKDTVWVQVEFVTDRGDRTELTLFMGDLVQAQLLAEALDNIEILQSPVEEFA